MRKCLLKEDIDSIVASENLGSMIPFINNAEIAGTNDAETSKKLNMLEQIYNRIEELA